MIRALLLFLVFVSAVWCKEPSSKMATFLDDHVLITSFDSNDVPSYVFSAHDTWKLDSSQKSQYSCQGANSKAGSFFINQIKYTLYKRKNPYFSANDAYQKDSRIKNFYFYEFYGKVVGLVEMATPLLAVDLSSRLVFSYGIPKTYGSILGRQIPKVWMPSDEHVHKDGKSYKFYQYNPIGWITLDGKVYLYDWFKKAQTDGNHTPQMNYPNQVAAPNQAGSSPYAP